MLKRRAKRKAIRQANHTRPLNDILADYGEEGMGYIIPPHISHVAIYFIQQNMAMPDAEEFYQHHESKQWRTVTGKPQKSWKVLAKDWIYQALQNAKLLERKEAKKLAFPDT